MGDKGEGGAKYLKKWVMSFMDSPQKENEKSDVMLWNKKKPF